MYYQHRHKIILQWKSQTQYQSDKFAIANLTIVCYITIISDRVHNRGKKRRRSIPSDCYKLHESCEGWEGLHIIVNCLVNLLYALLLRFLSCISGEIIMALFERTTDLITSPNRRRKARLPSPCFEWEMPECDCELLSCVMRFFNSFSPFEYLSLTISCDGKIGKKSSHMTVNVICNQQIAELIDVIFWLSYKHVTFRWNKTILKTRYHWLESLSAKTE